MTISENLAALDALYAAHNLTDAEEMLRRLICEAEESDNPGAALTYLNELVGLLRVTARAEEAVVQAEKALALIETLGALGSTVHGTCLLNAATANRAKGDLERALQYYHQAAQTFQSHAEDPDYVYHMAALYNNIGQVYQELADFRSAREFLQMALTMIGDIPGAEAEMAITRSNLALIHMELGEKNEALFQMEEAMKYYQRPESFADSHREEALSLAEIIREKCRV